MEETLQKPMMFAIFIAIGVLLKFKFKSKEEIVGIKKIILNLALPATIFLALLSIQISVELLWLPFLAILLNVLLFSVTPIVLPFLGIHKNTPRYRTARLLFPSLAPGLSCFPFISEMLGESYLAKAAMADLGNKVFVLIILYYIAIRWYYKVNSVEGGNGGSSKIKSLLMSLVSEPVNIFIVVALVFLSLGVSIQDLPSYLSGTMSRLSVLMTPLVLLFIGLSVKINRDKLITIISLLLMRAGIVVFCCAVCIALAGISIKEEIMLLLAFGLSACSFWPYAHIASISTKEKNSSDKRRTFDNDYAITILAISFPLSTLLIIAILMSDALFVNILNVFMLSAILISAGGLSVLVGRLKKHSYKNFQSKRKSGYKRIFSSFLNL